MNAQKEEYYKVYGFCLSKTFQFLRHKKQQSTL